MVPSLVDGIGSGSPETSPGRLPQAGGRSLGLLHRLKTLHIHMGRTLPAVGSFSGSLLLPLCFSALHILEAGGLQIALLEKADRNPCQFYFICLILTLPWGGSGYRALIQLMILHFSLKVTAFFLARKRWYLQDFK